MNFDQGHRPYTIFPALHFHFLFDRKAFKAPIPPIPPLKTLKLSYNMRLLKKEEQALLLWMNMCMERLQLEDESDDQLDQSAYNLGNLLEKSMRRRNGYVRNLKMFMSSKHYSHIFDNSGTVKVSYR
jgi:hypothetical protein